jgi:UDP-N-acetylglucosamine--N-acetylmuramyl-(pentapeptide) pyrophosphoryl-undecaprenol N-acetylglucosamine transferase
MALAIVFAGGGSSGHVFPALALAEALRRRVPDAELRFIGTQRGSEMKQVREAGYALDLVPSEPVLGRSLAGKLRALLALARGLARALRILRRARPDLVVGVGGYASVPTVLAAAALRIPCALLEPNAHPGRANRLLGRFASRVFVQFDAAAAAFPPGCAVRTGLPIREMPRPQDQPRGGCTRLLIVGGSQGARSINRAVVEQLDRIVGPDLLIEHQTGPYDVEGVREAYSAQGAKAEVSPFFDDLPLRLARADVLVARAGASTVAELCAVGVAAVLVPLPRADDHQAANARELEREGACVLVRDAELDRRLGDEVSALCRDAARRRRMAETARARGVPDAAARVADACLALARGALAESPA